MTDKLPPALPLPITQSAHDLSQRLSPPSTRMVWPVMYADSSLARNRTSAATSSAVPRRPREVRSSYAAMVSLEGTIRQALRAWRGQHER